MRRRALSVLVRLALAEAGVLLLGLLLLFGLKAWNEQPLEAVGIVQGGTAFNDAVAVATPVTVALLLAPPAVLLLARRRNRDPGTGP